MTLRRPAMILAVLASALVLLVAGTVVDHSGWGAQAYADDDTPQPQPANDNLATKTGGDNGQQTRCRDIPEAAGGVLIGYVVPCLAKTIEDTTTALCQKIVDFLMPIVWAFITLVIIFFGIKVLSGESEVYKEGFMLLLKIGIVVGVLTTLPTFIPYIYGTMEDTQQIVSTTIGNNSTSLHCDVDNYGDDKTLMVWKQLDCVLGKLYGITMGTNTQAGSDGSKHPSMLLVSSVVGVLGGFFFGGTFGVILFLACIGVLWTMFTIVLKTAFAFINSYLYASILLLIAPLFVPLVLLKASGNYFENWWRGMLGCFLLPLIITAYAMLAIELYDQILFAPDSEINKLFNMGNNNDLKTLLQAEQPSKQACDKQIGGNNQLQTDVSGIAQKVLFQSPFMQRFSGATRSGYNNLCAGLNTPVLVGKMIDPKKNYDTDKKAFGDMIKDCIKLFTVAWLVSAGFKSVQGFASNIIGSSAVVTSFQKPSKLESRFETGMAYAKQGLMGGLKGDDGRDVTGAAFIKRIPVAMGDAAGVTGDKRFPGFIGGISQTPNE